MRDEPREGWIPVYQDLERFDSAGEFAMSVYREIHHFLGTVNKITRRAKDLFSHLGGTEIGGVFKLPEGQSKPWKEILTRSVEDLIHENDAKNKRLLFLWDEVPYMLASIQRRENEKTAMEVLDVLRSLRQMHDDLRMVFTGSIGLHHVLASLRDHHYGNSPVNDMVAIDVPPLEEKDAVHLAGQLIEGEDLYAPDPTAAATAVAHEADYFPFYVHHIVRALKVRGLEATPDNVKQVVALQLVDANDPWQLLHYRDRIPTYYSDDKKTVLLILDDLAVRDTSSVDDLLAMIKRAIPFDDRERLLHILSLLERDHYVKRDHLGCFLFQFPLIRRWWKLNRGL